MSSSSDDKESACSARGQGSTLGEEDPLKKGMSTHSSILAWRIPWTEQTYKLTIFSFVAAYKNRHTYSKVNDIEYQEEIERRKEFVTSRLP